MAGAIIIACAIGILLLVLVGYVLVGSTLSSANIIASAQKDMAIKKEAQMRTQIDVTYTNKDSGYSLDFDVQNTGNEIITNLDQVGVVVTSTSSDIPIYFKKGTGDGNTYENNQGIWTAGGVPEVIHPGQWDPGEVLYCGINYIPYEPKVIYVFTENGVTDSQTVAW